MKNALLLASLGTALFLGTPTDAQAQDAEPVAPAKTEATEPKTRAVKIVNVPSALMAYWLDPKHNARPAMLGAEAPSTTNKAIFELTGDIERIVSIDAQKEILVTGGNDEDFQRLKELIAVLDQPMRFVEIEAQFVEMNREDAATFGIEFPAPQNDAGAPETPSFPTLQTVLVKGDFTERLQALIVRDKARLITAPRNVIANNFSADFVASETRELRLSSVSSGIPHPSEPSTFVQDVNWRVKPTINGDETLTFQIDITPKSSANAKVNSSKTLATVMVNLRDGNMFTLGNLPLLPASEATRNYQVPPLADIPLIGHLFRRQPQNFYETRLIFITARIVPVGRENTPKR